MLHLYLAPGFFGFTNLGELVYFGHVRDYLVRELARLGVEARVVAVASHPTASIQTRARALLAAMIQSAEDDGGPIHLIGHSSGGLDARLFASPGTALGDGLELEPFAAR